jgi:hypothetical protein
VRFYAAGLYVFLNIMRDDTCPELKAEPRESAQFGADPDGVESRSGRLITRDVGNETVFR